MRVADQGTAVGGVVVAGVVVDGGEVVGAGPRSFSVGAIGAGPRGAAGGDAAPAWSPTGTFGAGTAARAGEEGAGACAPAAPDVAVVGVGFVRFVVLSAFRITKVTAAKPSRKAATHAPMRSARRVRTSCGCSPSTPPAA